MIVRLFRGFKSRSEHLRALELSGDADAEAIKQAYYTLAKLYHPDVDPTQAERFKLIKEAYEALANSSPQPLEEFITRSSQKTDIKEPPPLLYKPYKKKVESDHDGLTFGEHVFWP